MSLESETRIAALPCWTGPIDIEPLPGGLSRPGYLVRDGGRRFTVRFGGEASLHGTDPRREAMIARRAAAAGLAPEVHWAGSDALVCAFVEARMLVPGDLADRAMLARVLTLLDRVAVLMPPPPGPPAPLGAVLRYASLLAASPNRRREAAARHGAVIADLSRRLAGRPRGFGHNDIHTGNILDDGRRLWLIDWEYAGAADPLGDRASLLVNGPDGLDPPVAPDDAALFADLCLAAALRDLFWFYAQDALGPGLVDTDSIAINEARVAHWIARGGCRPCRAR